MRGERTFSERQRGDCPYESNPKGIILFGYSGAGKTFLFKKLTGKQEDVYDPFNPNIGVGIYKDKNLSKITEIQKVKKMIYPEFEFYDFKGFPSGTGFPENYFKNFAELDLITCVVNNFTEDAHPNEETTSLLMELIFYDTEKIGRILQSRQESTEGHSGTQVEVLQKGLKLLEEEKLLNQLDEGERKDLLGMELLTLKPIVICFNGNKIQPALQYPCCIYLNTEAEDDVDSFYQLIIKQLSLITFYTVKGDIARAWLIPSHYTARQAAGTIHKDMEKGFVKAAVVNMKDFARAGSWQAARSAGTLKFLGPDSHLSDKDIVEFYFTQ